MLEKKSFDDPFADDFEVDETDAVEIPLPMIQWHTGKGEGFQSLHPVIAHGGFELPLDHFGNLVDNDKYAITEIPHKNSSEVGYLIPELHLSIVKRRFAWRIWKDGGTVNLGDRYEKGAYKRIQYYCFVKELGPEPAIFTIKGISGDHMDKVIVEHQKQVLRTAKKLHPKSIDYPQYCFWIPLKAGPPTEAGKGDNVSTITPPAAAWDSEPFLNGDVKAARQPALDLYVGSEFLKAINEIKSEAAEWAERWNWKKVSPGGEADDDQAPAANGRPNGGPPSTMDPQARFWQLVAQNGIEIAIAQEALLKTNNDYMAALTLLPMKQVDAIKAMNPPEDADPEEKAF